MSLVKGHVEEEGANKNPDLTAVFKLLEDQKKQILELQNQAPAVDLAAVVREAIRGVKDGNREEISVVTGIQLGDVPEDDYDERGVVFCAPTSGYAVTDYMKRGHRIIPPYGFRYILFEHKASRRVRSGKEEQIFYTATYTSHSKKVTKFLEENPLFGLAYYKSMKQMHSMDTKKLVRTAQLMNTVRDWDGVRVVKMCAQYGVPRHEELDVMKTQLVLAMLAKEDESQSKVSASRMNDSHKERLMTEQYGGKS